jgi:hypothetical protein
MLAVIGATGNTSWSLRQYLSNIPGKHEIKGLQTTAMLGTAHVLQKVLMYSTKHILGTKLQYM